MAKQTSILGIDPGSSRAGYALVVFQGDRVVDLELGTWVVPPGLGRAGGLGALSEIAEAWLLSRSPDVAAVETPFYAKNARSAFVLAEARGVLLSLVARRGIEVHEYPPATVKRTICGHGAADKEQVRRALALTVRGLGPAALESVGLDATDALALAVTHQAVQRVPLTARGRR